MVLLVDFPGIQENQKRKGLFEENGLDDDIATKLKELWISKLEGIGKGSKSKQSLPKVRGKHPKTSTSLSGLKKESTSKLKRRRRDDSKANLKLQEVEQKSNYEVEDFLSSSLILGAPKSINSKKNNIIGGQVDGPHDTSDEDEDIGKMTRVCVLCGVEPPPPLEILSPNHYLRHNIKTLLPDS